MISRFDKSLRKEKLTISPPDERNRLQQLKLVVSDPKNGDRKKMLQDLLPSPFIMPESNLPPIMNLVMDPFIKIILIRNTPTIVTQFVLANNNLPP